MEKEKEKFVNGMYVQKPNVEWKWMQMGLKYPEIIEEIKRLEKFKNENGYVSLDGKTSRAGKQYIEVNYFEKSTAIKPSDHSPDREKSDSPF